MHTSYHIFMHSSVVAHPFVWPRLLGQKFLASRALCLLVFFFYPRNLSATTHGSHVLIVRIRTTSCTNTSLFLRGASRQVFFLYTLFILNDASPHDTLGNGRLGSWPGVRRRVMGGRLCLFVFRGYVHSFLFDSVPTTRLSPHSLRVLACFTLISFSSPLSSHWRPPQNAHPFSAEALPRALACGGSATPSLRMNK